MLDATAASIGVGNEIEESVVVKQLGSTCRFLSHGNLSQLT